MPENRDGGDLSSSFERSGPPIRIVLTGTPALALAAICLVILSLGAVAAALLFVYLMWTHPDAANILLPLILAPLGGVIAVKGKEVVGRIADRAQASGTVDTGSSPQPSEGKK